MCRLIRQSLQQAGPRAATDPNGPLQADTQIGPALRSTHGPSRMHIPVGTGTAGA